MASSRTAVLLARHTSIRIGGWAPRYHAPRSLEEARCLLETLHGHGEKPFLLGGGANTLFPDGEFPRPVISTRKLTRWRVDGDVVWAECGVPLGTLVHAAMERGLRGLEGLVGVPGTVGGAALMNAGGCGWSFGSRVQELGLLSRHGGDWVRRKGEDVSWKYRGSDLGGSFVGWVSLRLEGGGDPLAIRAGMREVIHRKRTTQPLGQKSAGCVFRNPPGLHAGRLIDQLGLKGLSRGGARVSDRHANFIVNSAGTASSKDVRSLLEEVRERVADVFGVRLETEIVLV